MIYYSYCRNLDGNYEKLNTMEFTGGSGIRFLMEGIN